MPTKGVIIIEGLTDDDFVKLGSIGEVLLLYIFIPGIYDVEQGFCGSGFRSPTVSIGGVENFLYLLAAEFSVERDALPLRGCWLCCDYQVRQVGVTL